MMENDTLSIHYGLLLGIKSPWSVDDVRLDMKEKRVDIDVSYKAERGEHLHCPVCGQACPKKDLAKTRTWRHLDTMQFQTFIHARIPRANCEEHGVKNIGAPWTEPHSRFTLLFVRFAIDVLFACGNVSDAARLLNLSWDEVRHIQNMAVERGLARREEVEIKHLGMDEKNFKKGWKFITCLNDLDRQRVLDVAEGKTREAADTLLSSLGEATKESVQAVAVDMAPVFTESIRANLPDADIVYDKFHISKYLNEAVKAIWQSENGILRRRGDESLVGTKFLWLQNPENHSANDKNRFKQIKLSLYKAGRGWQIREAFRDFWTYKYEKRARDFFKRWYFWATHSRLKPIIKVARMLKRHLDGILTYLKHHLTNAGSEGLNSRIQMVKANARGFRNFKHFRTAILFYCGGLELYP